MLHAVAAWRRRVRPRPPASPSRRSRRRRRLLAWWRRCARGRAPEGPRPPPPVAFTHISRLRRHGSKKCCRVLWFSISRILLCRRKMTSSHLYRSEAPRVREKALKPAGTFFRVEISAKCEVCVPSSEPQEWRSGRLHAPHPMGQEASSFVVCVWLPLEPHAHFYTIHHPPTITHRACNRSSGRRRFDRLDSIRLDRHTLRRIDHPPPRRSPHGRPNKGASTTTPWQPWQSSRRSGDSSAAGSGP